MKDAMGQKVTWEVNHSVVNNTYEVTLRFGHTAIVSW